MGKTQMEAAQVLGMPQSRLSRWIEAGLVEFEDYERKRGNRTPLEEKHMKELRTVQRLRQKGVSLQALREAAENLRARGLNPFSTGEFSVVEGEIVRAGEGKQPELISRNPGQLLLFELAQQATKAED